MSEIAKNDYYYKQYNIPTVDTLRDIYSDNYGAENYKCEVENNDRFPDYYTSLEAVRNAVAEPLIKIIKRYEEKTKKLSVEETKELLGADSSEPLYISINEILAGGPRTYLGKGM